MRVRVRVRQHVNPLGLAFEEFRGELPELEPGREVELEIGCAEAQFLFERAAQDDSRLYLGLEIRDRLVDWVNREARALGLPVYAVFCNANNHVRTLFPPGSVRRVFLNFPDPWFKRRHHKRRMIDETLVRDIHHILEPGGELFFQSDIWDLALDSMDMLERLDELYENRAGSWSFWRRGNPYGVRSWREAHCEEEGLPIWRLWYRRK
jgi:tRNA (guanine-N7-)-methyltransferase